MNWIDLCFRQVFGFPCHIHNGFLCPWVPTGLKCLHLPPCQRVLLLAVTLSFNYALTLTATCLPAFNNNFHSNFFLNSDLFGNRPCLELLCFQPSHFYNNEQFAISQQQTITATVFSSNSHIFISAVMLSFEEPVMIDWRHLTVNEPSIMSNPICACSRLFPLCKQLIMTYSYDLLLSSI